MECKNCKQGYTREGNAAYPDHIELCEFHASAPKQRDDLLTACVGLLAALDSIDGKSSAKSCPFERRALKAAISRAEGKP